MRANLKLALRVLARRKVFTAISLVGISLTLVVLVVAAAVIDNVFAAHQPQSRLDRMLVVSNVGMFGPESTEITNPGWAFLNATVRNLPGAERVALTSEIETAVVYQGGGRLEGAQKRVNAEYWRVFDHPFLEGAPFAEGEVDGNRSVAVISENLRGQLFGQAPALGRTINIGGTPHQIIGVVRNVSLAQTWAYADLWLPLTPPNSEERTATFGRLMAIVLAKPGADIPAMKREFAARVARYPIPDPKRFKELRSGLNTAFESFAIQAMHHENSDRAVMYVAGVMLAVALLFMTLPALNLITLNLSRIMERSSEIGVRKAFGAPRRALIGQFVVENIILTLLGGVIAFVLALLALQGIEVASVVPGAHFTLNLRVFGYGMLIAAFFGLLSGVYPAWRMSRMDPVNALRGGAA